MLDSHATSWYGCEARGSRDGLKKGQMDLFSTLSASGLRKKYYILHSLFSPQKNILWGEMAAEKVEHQRDHPGVAAVNDLAYCRVICHGDERWLWASPSHNRTHLLWNPNSFFFLLLLYTSISNKISN